MAVAVGTLSCCTLTLSCSSGSNSAAVPATILNTANNILTQAEVTAIATAAAASIAVPLVIAISDRRGRIAPSTQAGAPATALSNFGVSVPYASGHKSATDSLRFTLDLPRQVRLIAGSIAGANIDLVYVNGPRLLPAAALATKRRIPILFHAHNHLRGSALKAARWSLRRSAATVAGCGKSVLEALERKQHIVPNGVATLAIGSVFSMFPGGLEPSAASLPRRDRWSS